MTEYSRNGYGSGANNSDMTIGDYANGMPSIRIGEFIKSFARQLKWMIPLFLLGAIPVWFLTKDIKRTYEGHASVMVQAGSEYFYTSDTQQAQGQGVMLTPDTITLNESAIMKNNKIIADVATFMMDNYPGQLSRELEMDVNNMTGPAKDQAKVELHKFVDRNYAVMPRPKTGVVDLVYKHENPEIAKLMVNTFLSNYQIRRQELFTEGAADAFGESREKAEEELGKRDREIQSFLSKNGIANFESERTGATDRAENLRAELNTTRSQMSEAEAALATVEAQLRATTEQINLYVDDRGSQRVAQAELELQQLLAKYLPSSDPVRAKQTEIAELKSLQRANGGNAIGGRRVGPNPTYQGLMERRNTLQSQADSYREKEFTIQQLLNQADGKVRKLKQLEPQYNNLLRVRSTWDDRHKGLSSKEQEALIKQDQAKSENIKPITTAVLARKGRNMQKIMGALMMLAWGFTLFMVALLRVFLDPRLYSTSSVPNRARPRRATDYQDYGYSPAIPNGVSNTVPSRPAAQPYVPESVPVQPAAYYNEPHAPFSAAPMASPPAYQDPYANPAQYQPMPSVPNTATSYDVYSNPYAEPMVQTTQPVFGAIPSSEYE